MVIKVNSSCRDISAIGGKRVLVAHDDDVAASLAANTQDFLPDLFIRDRIAGLTAVADELHPRYRTLLSQSGYHSPIASDIPAAIMAENCLARKAHGFPRLQPPK